MNPIPNQILNYYRRALPEPPASPQGTLLEQVGQMRLGPDKPWMPFTAEQRVQAETTEFVWHARFKMAPLVTGLVQDSYEQGQGRLDAKIWSVIPVAHARGPEIDQGEAQRYLAELPWCPMALVHNPELRYRELASDRVRVWVHNQQIHDESTYVDLHFDAAGDIVVARTETRKHGEWAEPWEGHFWDYRDFEGLRAPAKAEVAWETAQGRFVYWRGEITALQWRGAL